MTKISKLVKSRRKALGLRQIDLSNKLGFTTMQFISNIERGLASLPPKHFIRASKLLKIDPDKLKRAAVQDFKLELERQVK